MSNGSFYHQFSDKTDLLVAVLEEAGAASRMVLHESTLAVPEGDRFAATRQVFATWFDMIDGAEDIVRIQLREQQNSDPRVQEIIRSLRQRAVATLASVLRRRLGDDALDAELAAHLVAALAYGVLMEYLDTPTAQRATRRAELTEGLARFVSGGIDGLRTPD